jgi:hypothetical protein
VRRRSVAALLLASLAAVSCERLNENHHPVCDVRSPTILMAESVKTAALIPCVRALPAGWRFEAFEARDGEATFSLDAPTGGDGAVRVSLRRSCTAVGTPAPSGAPGARLTEEVRSRDPYAAHRTYAFDGGCAIVDVAFVAGAPVAALLRDLRSALSFLPRAEIARTLEHRQGGRLDPATA